MKKLILLALVILGVNFSFAQTQKFGYVDIQEISEKLPEAIKAKSDLEGVANKWQTELDSMTANYQKAIADYQKQAATMKEDKKKTVQQTIMGQEDNIRRFQQEKFAQGTGEYYQRQEKLLKPIRDRIISAIEAVAKRETISFVIDNSNNLVLPYVEAQYDITYKVLDYLKTSK